MSGLILSAPCIYIFISYTRLRVINEKYYNSKIKKKTKGPWSRRDPEGFSSGFTVLRGVPRTSIFTRGRETLLGKRNDKKKNKKNHLEPSM